MASQARQGLRSRSSNGRRRLVSLARPDEPRGEETVEARKARRRPTGGRAACADRPPASRTRRARRFRRPRSARRRTSGLRRSSAAICASPSSGSSEQVQIDDRAAGPASARSPCRGAAPAARRARRDRRPLDPGDVGMAADRAGRRAGRVEKDGVERRRFEGQRVGHHDLEVRRRRSKLAARSFSRSAERSTAVTSRAGRGELRALAARRRAEIDDPHARRGAGAVAPAAPRRRPAPTIRRRRSLRVRGSADGCRGAPSRSAARSRRGARAHPAASHLTLMSSVGSERWASAMARAALSP